MGISNMEKATGRRNEREKKGRGKGGKTTGNEEGHRAAFHATLGQKEKIGKATWWAQNRIMVRMCSNVK